MDEIRWLYFGVELPWVIWRLTPKAKSWDCPCEGPTLVSGYNGNFCSPMMFILANRAACGHTRFQCPLVRFFKWDPPSFFGSSFKVKWPFPETRLCLLYSAMQFIDRPEPIYAWGPWGSRGDPRIPRIRPWLRLWPSHRWKLSPGSSLRT